MARKKIKRRPSGRKPYFTKDTQAAIFEFCSAECSEEKAKIYESRILPALEKLAENLIFIYNFHKQTDDVDLLKHACVVNLYETLHKFDHTRGSNAFSYFNVVGKNWLIINARRVKKKRDRMVYMDDQDNLSIRDQIEINQSQYVPCPSHKMDQAENKQAMYEMLHELRHRLRSPLEIRCIEAIITVFEKVDDLDFLNKRAIFVYVRELSGLNPKQLSVCMSNIRKHYREIVGSGKQFDIF